MDKSKKSGAGSKGLVYNGGGYGGWIPGIPARDLSPVEVKKYGGKKYLLDLGIYEDPGSLLDSGPEEDQEGKSDG